MAYVKRRVKDGKVTWRARYREPDGTERSRSFAKRSDAERWLDSIRGDLVHGTYIDPLAVGASSVNMPPSGKQVVCTARRRRRGWSTTSGATSFPSSLTGR
jgi:hypothetical protein